MNKNKISTCIMVIEAIIDKKNNLVASIAENGSMSIAIELSHEAYLPILIETLTEQLREYEYKSAVK